MPAAPVPAAIGPPPPCQNSDPRLASLLALATSAQAAAPPERLRGTIESVEGGGFTLRPGRQEPAGDPGAGRQGLLGRPRPSSIRSRTACSSAPPPRASRRSPWRSCCSRNRCAGTGEGHYDWDMLPDHTGSAAVKSTMTNGTVKAAGPATAPDAPRVKSAMTNGTVKASGGGAERTLTVDYGKGQSIQSWSRRRPRWSPSRPRIPVRSLPARRRSWSPRAARTARSTARRVAVGKNGLTPPM